MSRLARLLPFHQDATQWRIHSIVAARSVNGLHEQWNHNIDYTCVSTVKLHSYTTIPARNTTGWRIAFQEPSRDSLNYYGRGEWRDSCEMWLCLWPLLSRLAESPGPRITRRASPTRARAAAAMSIQGAKHSLCTNKWKRFAKMLHSHYPGQASFAQVLEDAGNMASAG